MSSIVVYTVLVDDYDTLLPALFPDRAKYICFSDRPPTAPGWEYRYIDDQIEGPRRNSCRPKIRPHLFLPDHEVSFYHDACIQLLEDPVACCEEWLGESNLALWRHGRDCLYDEVEACKTFAWMRNTIGAELDLQAERYRAAGMPCHWGLFYSGMLPRRHLESDVVELSNLWWDEYTNNTFRDQVSLPYAMWKTGIEYSVVVPGGRSPFRITPHKKPRPKCNEGLKRT